MRLLVVQRGPNLIGIGEPMEREMPIAERFERQGWNFNSLLSTAVIAAGAAAISTVMAPFGMRMAVFAGLMMIAAIVSGTLAWLTRHNERQRGSWQTASISGGIGLAATVIADDERLIQALGAFHL